MYIYMYIYICTYVYMYIYTALSASPKIYIKFVAFRIILNQSSSSAINTWNFCCLGSLKCSNHHFHHKVATFQSK